MAANLDPLPIELEWFKLRGPRAKTPRGWGPTGDKEMDDALQDAKLPRRLQARREPPATPG